MLLRVFTSSFVFLAVVAAVAATKEDQPCGYDFCPEGEPGMLNVHIVAHTHLDAGWIKTVDEYYYGSKKDLAPGAVQYAYDAVIDELVKDSRRRFIMVESAYFWRWWRNQHDIKRHVVRRLVWDGQLEFTGGGWVMNDEASSHYGAIIDNMEHGFRVLNDSFGKCAVPKIGWQIDPFGHAKEQAALFAQMGFDGFLLGRADFQDVDKRRKEKTTGMIWKGDEELGDAGSIYTEILPNGYSPPDGFCFDVYCNDDPIMDDHRLEGYNVDKKVDAFIKVVQRYAEWTDTNTVIVTMGNDFNYIDARWWFSNLDKLIDYTNARQQTNGTKINLMYSTPACYVQALNSVSSKSNKKWTTKSDDFFPYASDPHAYWTGYFTSRTTLKQYIRTSDAFLKVCKQLDMLARLGPMDQHDMNVLREAVLLGQHHDAITGTSRQLVAYDYAKRLAAGVTECEQTIDDALQQLITGDGDVLGPKQMFCQLLNISQCAVTENSPNVAITVYNPLPRDVTQYVRIPVVDGAYEVLAGKEQTPVASQTVPISDITKNIPDRDSKATQELVFKVALPSVGFQVYFIARSSSSSKRTRSRNISSPSRVTANNRVRTDKMFENQYISITFDSRSGILKQMTDKASGVQLPLKQSIGYYVGTSGDNSKFENRASGAYIFRPNCTGMTGGSAACVRSVALNNKVEIAEGPIVSEVRTSNEWLSLVTRLYVDVPEVEFEWTAGPIPTNDGLGKEVVVRFETELASDGKFSTDSNGRQLLVRQRDQRPTWQLNVTEPISGNYYPIQSYLGIDDGKTAFSVLVDRAYGGSSLKDGQVEVMVHRRLLHDDAFGVDQALNESGVDGRGLVSRGILYASLMPVTKAPALRLRVQQLYAPAALTFTPDMTAQAWDSQYTTTRSGLQQALPPQINLLTLQQWRASMILVRLEHMFKRDEDPDNLGQPAQVDLRNLLTNFTVIHAQELSLGANMAVEELENRFKWNTADSGDDERNSIRVRRALMPNDDSSIEDRLQRRRGGHLIDNDLVITIKPMEIRTFQMLLDDYPAKV